ncbi:MAG TPA: mercuric reductase, partial [Thermoanaerobaculia bacterium]|nr:mercuric reductase [Thermoanaerobaculia bacterium]
SCMKESRGEGIYNVVVIGGGTAGLVTAATTAGLGGRVALIERGKMGGDCLNTGCVPSKALISSARLANQIRHGDRWGFAAEEPNFEFEQIFQRMRERRDRIAPHDSRERFEKLGVEVFAGSARFVSPNEVAVGDTKLKARNVVIATGSRAQIPSITGLSDVTFFTSETIFDDLGERPARMVILGGGPIGCELAQVFARLRVSVTLLQRAPRILKREDADASDEVRRALESEGVRVMTGADVQIVTRQGSRTRAWVEVEGRDREPIDCETILIAAGRMPNVEGLDLEKACVAYTGTGITVDAHLRTSQPHIYAAGDVAGPYHFTHLADLHARTIARNILVPRFPVKVDLSVLPWCTFTSPELARVGINEEEAVRRGISYDLYRQPMYEIDRAVVESEEMGFAKVLASRRGDRILGATIVSERAGDLIHEFALAMRAGVGLQTISRTVHVYPTYAEVARKIADQHQRRRLTPMAQRLLAFLYKRQRRKLP